MILARCPHCETTFRAAPEALKQRAGKVRCGKCHQVFNALDHVVADTAPTPATPFKVPPANVIAVAPFSLVPPPSPADQDEPELTEEHFAEVGESKVVTNQGEETAAKPVADQAAETRRDDDATNLQTNSPAEPNAHDPLFETPDGDGVAARDTRDAAGYSKWAEGTLSAPSMHFDEPQKTGWLSVLLLVILALMLLVQGVHFWRTEIANRWPESRPWLEEACLSFGCTVPYPQDIAQISLEASELQIDPERGGLLVLSMTLKNRSPIAQTLPSVELTLTDSRDNVVIRRLLAPNEWLPTLPDAGMTSTLTAFPAGREIAARLWIDAVDTGAVGYRLFLLYP